MIPLRDNIPSKKISFINYILIGLNIAIFVYQMRLFSNSTLDEFIISYGVIPKHLISDPLERYFSLISSQFLHGSLMHLIGNMLYIYIFGDNVEDKFGHIGYLLLYLAFGVCAALAQIYFHQTSSLPMIGASGAIAGVLGSYFLFYPNAKVLTLIPLGIFSRVAEVPAFYFLGFWFLMQTFSGTTSYYAARTMGQELGGVAWWAHAGGFVSGLITAFIYKLMHISNR